MTLSPQLVLAEAELILQQLARAQARVAALAAARAVSEEDTEPYIYLKSCSSCGPMQSISFDHDGAVRCGQCSGLAGFLPPWRCNYFGHSEGCACGYSYAEALSECWFWSLIELEVQQGLLTLGEMQTVLEGGAAA